jgi:hypothetical protein
MLRLMLSIAASSPLKKGANQTRKKASETPARQIRTRCFLAAQASGSSYLASRRLETLPDNKCRVTNSAGLNLAEMLCNYLISFSPHLSISFVIGLQ